MTKAYISRLATAVNNLGFFKLKKIAKLRPFTTILLAASMAILIGLTVFAYRLTAVDKPLSWYVGIDPQSRVNIRSIGVQAECFSSGKDILRILISFAVLPEIPDNKSNSNLAGIRLTVPRQLDLKSSMLTNEIIKQKEEVTYENSRWLFYRVTGNGSSSEGITAEFVGNLFHASEQDLWADINIEVEAVWPANMEVTGDIFGLTNIALESVWPEPYRKTPYGLSYKWTATDDSLERGRIVVRGTDKSRVSRLGAYLFAIGAICGVFGSIIASLIIDLANHYDERILSVKGSKSS